MHNDYLNLFQQCSQICSDSYLFQANHRAEGSNSQPRRFRRTAKKLIRNKNIFKNLKIREDCLHILYTKLNKKACEHCFSCTYIQYIIIKSVGSFLTVCWGFRAEWGQVIVGYTTHTVHRPLTASHIQELYPHCQQIFFAVCD